MKILYTHGPNQHVKRALILLLLMATVRAAVEVEYDFNMRFREPGRHNVSVDNTLYSFRVNAARNSRLKYREVSGVTRPPEGIDIYEYAEVDEEGDLRDIELVFSIPRLWFEKRNLTTDDALILELFNGEWYPVGHRHVETTLTRELFEVDVDTLSVFAVGTAAVDEEEEPGVVCPESERSECVDGKRTRTYHELVDGECVEMSATEDCPVELGTAPDYSGTYLAVGAMLALTLGLGYFILQLGPGV